MIDNDERNQLEEELRHRAEQLTEANRRKDEFLAVLAHELRNPLAPIHNALQLLRIRFQSLPEAHEPLDIMERQIRHMVRLVDDLLEVSRITRGKVVIRKERVELDSILQSAIETCRPLLDASQHELSISLPSTPVYLMADSTRLAQVFSNLLNNAAKYTEPGGRIEIRAEVVASPDGFGSEVLISVRDTGIGIAADLLPRVFDMFGQLENSLERSRGGLGIGLTLARRLVQLHGGSVQAYSEGLGKGSEFVVRLPLSVQQSPIPSSNVEEKAPKEPSMKRRILIVDDNEDSAETLGAVLDILGHEVQLAHDGSSALELVQCYHPEVILLDIGLPGMNGHEVARQIRALPGMQDVLLIAQTGWGQKEDRERSRDAGFDHHLVKPIDPDVLKKLI